MKSWYGWFLVVALAGLLSLTVRIAPAAPSKLHGVKLGLRSLLKIEQEYVATLGGDDSALKKGMKVDLYLQSGKKVEGLEITELQLGKPKNSLKLLGGSLVKGGKQKFAANQLLHIVAEELVFDVAQDPANKAFVVLDLARRDELARKRLATTGHSLWEEPTEDDRKQTIDDSKKLFKKARELFPDQQFQLHETEFYLFYTDIPADQVTGYVTNLDAMYQQLCVAFGILPDKNIWKGKCPIIAFVENEMFYQFEATVMNNPNARTAQGLHHGSSDGSVVITVYRGNDPAFFATVLVHETAHGFLHRLRSNVHITSWLNEGIADWIAGVVVPASNVVSRRQSDAIATMRTNRSMGGFFEKDKKFRQNEYGIASNLAEFMLQTDSNLYRAFLMAIKDGYSVEESLKPTYDCTPADLIQSYGNSIGVPDLRP